MGSGALVVKSLLLYVRATPARPGPLSHGELLRDSPKAFFPLYDCGALCSTGVNENPSPHRSFPSEDGFLSVGRPMAFVSRKRVPPPTTPLLFPPIQSGSLFFKNVTPPLFPPLRQSF